MIQTMGDGLMLGLVFTAAFTTAISGWVLSRSAPKEVIDLFTEEGPRAQRMALKLRYYTIAAAMVVCRLVVVLGDGNWLDLYRLCRHFATLGDIQPHGRSGD